MDRSRPGSAADTGAVVDRSRPGSNPPRSAPPDAGAVDRSRPGSAPTTAADTGAVVDRSRPGSTPPRSAPPTPEAGAVDRSRPSSAPAMDGGDAVDRSRPGSRPAAVLTPAAPAPIAPTPWVDSVGPATPAGPGFAPSAASMPAAGFGRAPAGIDPTFTSPPYAGPPGRRSRKGPIVALVVALLVVAGGAAFGVPRYLAAQALTVAAAQPDVLVRTAPATLAGQHRVTVAGVRTDAVASSMTSAGATWAWAQTYGTSSALTIYLASDVPLSERPTAVRALTSHDAATDLLATVSKGLAAGANGSLVTGAPTEYASPVAGKTWCMPITVSGVAGGYCLWTSGKELLQTLSLPGLQEVAAKSTLDALTQMVKTVTKSAGRPASALVPKASPTK